MINIIIEIIWKEQDIIINVLIVVGIKINQIIDLLISTITIIGGFKSGVCIKRYKSGETNNFPGYRWCIK